MAQIYHPECLFTDVAFKIEVPEQEREKTHTSYKDEFALSILTDVVSYLQKNGIKAGQARVGSGCPGAVSADFDLGDVVSIIGIKYPGDSLHAYGLIASWYNPKFFKGLFGKKHTHAEIDKIMEKYCFAIDDALNHDRRFLEHKWFAWRNSRKLGSMKALFDPFDQQAATVERSNTPKKDEDHKSN